ncbi:hypothetical protein [Streptomyces caatingaensis]|uniref:Uncharacterized protein n=1 Tax=Streptomyces caatingaensis TaxID=1678637 RepID=A0A0K9XJS6_9ACTN|nr:hypothetical protein [Streptomyces caatingaensis]KNB52912.1 hypothetical protein AC230_09810 [Streptomyces caatingaensis]
MPREVIPRPARRILQAALVVGAEAALPPGPLRDLTVLCAGALLELLPLPALRACFRALRATVRARLVRSSNAPACLARSAGGRARRGSEVDER